MFVNFLERESTPPRTMALPASQMADQQQRKPRPAVPFNPFNSLRQANSDGEPTIGGNTTSNSATTSGLMQAVGDAEHPLIQAANSPLSIRLSDTPSSTSVMSVAPAQSALLETILQPAK